jgi:Flp pilus assembly protein TadB
MDCSLDKSYKLHSAAYRPQIVTAGEGDTMSFGPFLLIAILLLLAWVAGFLMFHIASVLFHVLLVLAVLSFIFHFITGRRTA